MRTEHVKAPAFEIRRDLLADLVFKILEFVGDFHVNVDIAVIDALTSTRTVRFVPSALEEPKPVMLAIMGTLFSR
jgi:hypothetical protein